MDYRGPQKNQQAQKEKTMETNKAFETNKMRVMIEGLTHTGSAFGTNEAGDTVFFNQRLVEKVELEIGDIVEAYAIPNYEDKRDETPWRAIKVDIATPWALFFPLGVTVPEVPARTAAQLDEEVLNLLGEDSGEAYCTTAELADAAGTDTKTMGNSCLRLFNKGLIAKADVHGRPNQERATFCLWARNTAQFIDGAR